MFQFQMVRLKAGLLREGDEAHSFQFQMVRLKGRKRRGSITVTWFQFQMVRLKVRSAMTTRSRRLVSIPNGTIKRSLNISFLYGELCFNSKWYD